jgi:hypothetical protein
LWCREPVQACTAVDTHAWQSTTPQQAAMPGFGSYAGRCPPRQSSCLPASLVLRPAGISTIATGAVEYTPWNCFSPTPKRGFLGRQLLHSLYRSVICNASGNRLQGSISDLFRSSPEACARGSSVEAAYALVSSWFKHGISTLYSSIVVHCVQSLYINRMQ